MRIGNLAAECGLTTKTLRYYESLGLLTADRTPAGYRSYDEGAIDRLQFIRDAQASGLSLIEIKSILELKDSGARSCDHTASLLDRHIREIDEQMERLRVARDELQRLATRARELDPAACTDPHRCQVISGPSS
jgi:DNA-binding transcriptional MerR regulator